MPVIELVTSSGLGSLLGMRHALEPDHLAAVSTLVTGERRTPKGALLGACWGARPHRRAALLGSWGGFAPPFALVVGGGVLVVRPAKMPPRAADLFELG